MRQLTRLQLGRGGLLQLHSLQLLATLAVLASLCLWACQFEWGDEQMLAQWLAIGAALHSGSACRKRKAGDAVDDGDNAGESKEDERGEERRVNDDSAVVYERYSPDEDPNDPALPQRHSSLLVFLHQLAAKPSLVHLQLDQCGLNPFVMDHMPVWPHLRCLTVEDNRELRGYGFEGVAARLPALTSLTTSECSDAAIAQLVALPRVE